jgi:DNA repair protein RecN (Recombination protein N)
MLTQIHIKDLAIVSTLELELNPGMTALTGETGAGKSILIDALGLALGERADNSMIRTGCERAEITAVFNVGAITPVTDWLHEHSLDSGDECILRRVLVESGSSRAFVNGSPIPIRSLQELGNLLVDIHGQHAHQSLLHREQQRDLLDEYALHSDMRKQLTQTYDQWRSSAQRLEQLQMESSDRVERMELLQYQVGELQELQLSEGEMDQLDEEHKRLSNASKLQDGAGRLLGILYDDERSLHDALASATNELEELAAIDQNLNETQQMVADATIQTQEASHALRHYLDGIGLDPVRLDEIEQRLSLIHDLSRKHNCKGRELPQLLITLQDELEALESAGANLEVLENEVAALRSSYLELANTLDRERRSAAEKLQQEVTDGIQSLGMPGGVFEVGIETLGEERAASHGLNKVEFLVSANPGHPVKPLNKVASGGELSRISLAIQVATVRCSGVPILIFDEVDVGIGGGVAETVGQLLHRLGEHRQVLCVTHLPQVAAQGHHHLQIAKSEQKGEIKTEISSLHEDDRIQEIARMLGGLKITEQTLAHAREMVATAP